MENAVLAAKNNYVGNTYAQICVVQFFIKKFCKQISLFKLKISVKNQMKKPYRFLSEYVRTYVLIWNF